ncbi:Crp/Fnr family transcriptional regulator [Chitinophaga sp. CF418]|uniref:Crp/Fnr family transcriptional regulator n=1 Tax=Chitinophaga sp. CF418 TaxID=1855287 RepID=UPI00091A3AC5|nr:Crp/Fnr family transcriptional regulator [Chitinophaga sp. CF418]SHN20038.1 cAMP-binding domain of CRP or a regulatory subunit of cAMP-dependent protein kinases [Chitinophaga sp. CF418]
MYDRLFHYIEQYSNSTLSESEKEVLTNTWKPQTLKKKAFFLREGELCNFAGFIVKGAMRQYTVDDNGIEHVSELAIENWWIVDRKSYFERTPATTYIEAWENTEMLVLKRSNLDIILEIPSIKEMFWQMNQRNQIASQQRLNDIVSLPASKRYENLQKKYPAIIERFPQHIIASYLGITKETLSRVRNRIAGKNP